MLTHLLIQVYFKLRVAEALILGTMMVGQAMAFAPNFSKAKIAASKLITLFNRTPAIDTSDNVGQKMVFLTRSFFFFREVGDSL